MDRLPTEILQAIIEQLREESDASLASYVTVSRAWKAAIEKHIFRRLKIDTTQLDTFATLFKNENISRRTSLEALYITFILPPPPSNPECCDVEWNQATEADGLSFSNSVYRLFSILSDIDVRTLGKYPLYLYFEKGRRQALNRSLPCAIERTSEQIAVARSQWKQFGLVNTASIPKVNNVIDFRFYGYNELLLLKQTSVSKLAALLPDLQTFVFCTEDEYQFGRSKRYELRQRFTTSILRLPTEHLRELRLKVSTSSMRNEDVPVQRLVEPGSGQEEHWLSIMRHLSTLQSLAVLDISGRVAVCPDLFQSISSAAGTPFPALEEFVFEFAPETADGGWFFIRDEEAFHRSRADPKYEEFWQEWDSTSDIGNEEDEDDEEEGYYDGSDLNSVDGFDVFEDSPNRTRVVRYDRYRSLPDPTTISPFLKGAAKVVQRLQKLRKFILKLNDGVCSGEAYALDYPFLVRALEVWYLRAGTRRTLDDPWSYPKILCDAKYLHQNRLYWRIGDWKLEEDVQMEWLNAVGQDTKTVFLDESKYHIARGIFEKGVYEEEF